MLNSVANTTQPDDIKLVFLGVAIVMMAVNFSRSSTARATVWLNQMPSMNREIDIAPSSFGFLGLPTIVLRRLAPILLVPTSFGFKSLVPVFSIPSFLMLICFSRMMFGPLRCPPNSYVPISEVPLPRVICLLFFGPRHSMMLDDFEVYANH